MSYSFVCSDPEIMATARQTTIDDDIPNEVRIRMKQARINLLREERNKFQKSFFTFLIYLHHISLPLYIPKKCDANMASPYQRNVAKKCDANLCLSIPKKCGKEMWCKYGLSIPTKCGKEM